MWARRCRCCCVLLLCSLHHVLTLTCDTSEGLLIFVLNPIPTLDPFTNMNTVGPGCSNNPSTGNFECAIVGNLHPVLIDGQLGSKESPPNASSINAWSRSRGQTVTITFIYTSSPSVRHVRLYFYHVPSMGIGLPDVRLEVGGQPQPYFVTGNQNLSSTDARRRNVILSFAGTITAGNRFTVNFDFNEESNVDWLLLSEVQLCTEPNRVLRPSAAPQLVPATPEVRTPDEINPNLTLSCTVSGEGKFSWAWTGPQVPVMVWTSDFTRTTMANFTGIRRLDSGENGYRCTATYDPMVAGASFDMSASHEFSVDLQFSFARIGSNMIVVKAGDNVTLSCEIYGYLQSSFDIMWKENNVGIDNADPAYTTTIMQSDKLIQDGGQSPGPSIISQLNFTTTNMSLEQQTYSCVWREQALFFFVTTTDIVTTVSQSTTSTDTVVASVGSTPTIASTDTLVVVIAVVGFLVLLILVVIIAIVIIIIRKKQSERKIRLHQTRRKDSLDYSVEPVYQEMPQPAPPPIPDRFPSQSQEIEAYAVVDTKQRPNGFFEMTEIDNKSSLKRGTLSSTSSGGTEKLPFLERNPIYDSSDQLDDSRGRSTSRSPKNWSTPQHDDSQLNIYARPCHVKPPPIPQRIATPELLDEPLYSEADFKPALFTSSRASTMSPSSDVRELPCVSIYDDPEPLIRSEGPKEIFPGNVQEVRELGVGQFGQVILAKTVGLSLKDLQIDENDNNSNISIYVAVKKLKPSAETHVKEAFEKEIKFMSRLRNRNVIRLLAICPSSNSFIVMEYMPNGDLNQFLQNRKLATKGVKSDINIALTRSDLVYVCLQIASGMKYLATFRFIHRDLATRNCLVGDNLAIKIADFGMSRSLYSSYYYRISGRAMLPIRWMANECFYGKFSEKTDVWAFGVTMWEAFMFAREQPYDEMSDQEVIDDAIKGPHRKLLPRPDCCPVEVYEVMKRCWVDEPTERTRFNKVHSLLEAIYEYGNFDEL